jgi:hypothetical protein
MLPFFNVQLPGQPLSAAFSYILPCCEHGWSTAMTTSASSPAPRALAEPSEPAPFSNGVRTTINLLLFIHLFSLGAMCLFNGSETGLREQLRKVPGYYLQVLGMDVDFDSGQRFNWQLQSRDTRQQLVRLRNHLTSTEYYEAEKELTALLETQKQNPRNMSRRGLYHLTHADVLDVGHFLELRYTRDGEQHSLGLPGFSRRGGAGGDVTAQLPATVGWQWFWPRQRYQRYLALSREVGRLAGQETLQDILPAALAEGMLRAEGIELSELAATQPRLFCYRLTTRDQMQTMAAGEPTSEPWVQDPWHANWFQPVYQKVPLAVGGRVRFNDDTSLPRDYAPKVSDE